jgi:hypothetical protein
MSRRNYCGLLPDCHLEFSKAGCLSFAQRAFLDLDDFPRRKVGVPPYAPVVTRPVIRILPIRRGWAS